MCDIFRGVSLKRILDELSVLLRAPESFAGINSSQFSVTCVMNRGLDHDLSPIWVKQLAKLMRIYFNEKAKRKRLGCSGTFMAQWFRRWTLQRATRGSIPARSITLVAAVTRVRLSGSSPPWLKVARARGLGFQKGGGGGVM